MRVPQARLHLVPPAIIKQLSQILKQLRSTKAMLDEGIITQADIEANKSALLDELLRSMKSAIWLLSCFEERARAGK